MGIMPKRKRAFVGCSGLGLVDIALHNFGFDVTGIEIDDRIASIARMNGLNTITANLLDIDPRDYTDIDLFHISPPCPKFSIARNSKALQSLIETISDLARHQSVVNGETEIDIALARKTIEIIRVTMPEFVTIENVYGYRKSLSWAIIAYGLEELGYSWDAWNLNSADYGVPQTRRRMIAIARRDGRKPAKPFPTHSNKPDMFTAPWVGWYEAIEDLIPTLPDSQFAPWQLDRLPSEIRQSLLVMTGNTNRAEGAIVGRGVIGEAEPTNTVLEGLSGGMPKAFLMRSSNTQQEGKRNGRYQDEPVLTVTVDEKPKAFIVGDRKSGDVGITKRSFNEPVMTVMEGHGKALKYKAFVIGNGERSMPKSTLTPMDTVTNNRNQNSIKAFVANGRVVKLTPRCLARFQTIPDWYKLRGSLGIGNGLPVKLYEAILTSLGLKIC